MSLQSLTNLLIVGAGLLVASLAHAQSSNAQSNDMPPAGPAELPSQEPTPPAGTPTPPAPSTRETAAATPDDPWFVRPPIVVTFGGKAFWNLTIYGFAEADMMGDSTRSFNDGLNANVIAHDQTQAGNNTRLQFTIRNSRFGFRVEAPPFGGVRSSGVLEFDLFGNQPNINSGGGSPGQAPGPGNTTEAAYFNNAGLRVRHAYVKLEDDVADVLAGQSYHLLGWQNYFFGASCGFLGLPNELFNRTVQLRLSHTFAFDRVKLDVAAAALRPAQRDSAMPDGEGGLRLAINHWKAMTTPGSGGTGAQAAAIGVSGLVRSFRVNQYAPQPAPPIPLTGWAVAADLLLPIIPVKDSTDRRNALTVTGEFATGTGDADQYTGMTAGATMPNVYPLPGECRGNRHADRDGGSPSRRSAVHAQRRPRPRGVRHERRPSHYQLANLSRRRPVLPASDRPRLHRRELQLGQFQQHRESLSSCFDRLSVGQFGGRVPVLVVRRWQHLLRRHAGRSGGPFVSTCHAGHGRWNERVQQSLRDNLSLFLLERPAERAARKTLRLHFVRRSACESPGRG
jgi:hypothetical protein